MEIGIIKHTTWLLVYHNQKRMVLCSCKFWGLNIYLQILVLEKL